LGNSKNRNFESKIEMRMLLTIRNYAIFGLLFFALTCCSNKSTVTIADETGKNIESLKAEAEKGKTNAQCNLGLCYQNGEGVEKDNAEAVKWLREARKATEQGLAEAQYNLGVYYDKGEGVEKDSKMVPQSSGTGIGWCKREATTNRKLKNQIVPNRLKRKLKREMLKYRKSAVFATFWANL
jgi:hypothetical protein